MNSDMLRNILDATRLTRAGQLVEATNLLRRSLDGTSAARAAGLWPGAARSAARHAPCNPPTIDGALAPDEPAPSRTGTDVAHKEGLFISAVHAGAAGRLAYRLYIPSGYHGQPVPLVIMLHGCSQSPEDFAAGTRMNEAAEAQTCLIAYPSQTKGANASKCWNWFSTGHQTRDRGEPALIAGITRDVMQRYGADPRRVYVAGMSAGGAAASIMGAVYPDLYAAVGVHSGLPCGAAHDVSSALAAMRQGSRPPAATDDGRAGAVIPSIVFHGDRDTTVHPDNADAIIARSHIEEALTTRTEHGQVRHGRSYDVTRYARRSGQVVLEQWVVHGSGHGWSGGSSNGSYTDPKGPDASTEMLRFFLQHSNNVAPVPGSPG
jgi:poly(hydroxyalkanoate) depolymerase family esterase